MKFLTLVLIALQCLFAPFGFGDDEEKKIAEAMPDKPTVKPKKSHKILVYSKPSGFRHGSIPTGIKGLRIMAEKTQAFEATFTLETTEFTKEGLAKYDMIIFNNCTHVQKAFTEQAQRDAILGFIKSGKAFAGFHSASDGGMPQWQEYTDMIGGCFAGHPWNAGGKWPFFVEDVEHPVNQAFKEKEFTFSDEIYQYKGYDRSKLRILIGLDSVKSGKKGNSKTTIRFPGFARTARARSSIPISATTRQLGGLHTFCSISWTVSNGPWATWMVLPNPFRNQEI